MNKILSMPASSSDKLGHAIRSAMCGFTNDLRMHEIRREIWRGLLSRVQRAGIRTKPN
jgi:hypothetical protein